MKANKTIITLLITTLTIAPTFAKKVCAPHEINVADIQDELLQIEDNSYAHKISSIRSQQSRRESAISVKKRQLSSAQSVQGKLERRLHQLKYNMQKIKSELSSAISSEQRHILIKKQEVVKNEQKKQNCRSGVFGSICRKKYRSRANKAKESISSSKRRIQSAKKKLVSLPKEKASLPAKISRAKQTTQNASVQMNDVLSMKPTVSQMQNKISKLLQKQQAVGQEIEALEDQLVDAQQTQEKCEKMVKLAKAYPVLKKKIKMLQDEPELCDSISTILDNTDKQYKRKAIKDAAKIVCEDQYEQM